MAYKVRKTEKAGAKHGKGALWGTKKEAKHQSSRIRRRRGRAEIVATITEALQAHPSHGRLSEALMQSRSEERAGS